ncbi:MAG: hypothetical protein RhofKO_33780 [Rhodothermales bacterium]
MSQLRPFACLLSFLLIPLTSLAQTTASANLDAATVVAAQGQSRVDLLAVVATSANPDGTAPNWLYLYQTDDSALAGVFATGDVVANASLDLTQIGVDPGALVSLASPDPLGNEWRNSDDVLQRIEPQGGADFRATYPDAIISMILLDFPAENLIDFPGIEALGPYWLVAYTSASAGESEIFAVETLIPLIFPLAAVGGDDPPSVDDAVAAFAADAELVAISSVLPDLSASGTSLFWQRTYYSPSQGVARDFFVSLTGLVLGEVEGTTPASTTPLPATYLSASEALTIAFTEFNLPNNLSIGPLVQGRLQHGIDTATPDRLTWQFAAITMDGSGTVTTQQVLVDATTGAIVRVANEAAADLPTAATLAPNYPNPFRTTTTVQYTIATPTHATLTVYDVLGRSVRTLADEVHRTGTHHVEWNGVDDAGQRLPAGLYLYRLTTSDGATQSRSLVLVD